MSPNIILRVGEGFKLFKLFNDKKNNSLAFTLFLIFLFSKIVLLINDEMTTIDNAKLNIIIFEKDFFFFIMKKLIITDNATPGAGNVLLHGSLTTARDVKNGDVFKFNAGDLDVTFA